MAAKIFSFLHSQKLVYLSLIFVVVAMVLIYYQVEPSPADYVMAIAVGLAGLSYILRRKLEPFSWIDVPLVGYLIFVIVQAVIQHQTLDVRFAMITAYLVATYFILKYVVTMYPRSGLVWLFRAYMIGAVFTALLMIYQMVSVYSFDGSWGALYFGRPNGWFKDANVAGPFLLPVIFYGLYQYISTRRWVYLTLFLIISAGVFLSFSRGAYLGYVCGIIAIIGIYTYQSWAHRAIRWRGILYGLVATICAAGLWAGMQTYQPIYSLTIERFGVLIKDYDLQGRAVSWQAGVNGSGQSLFGKGSGSYERESLKYQQGLESTSSADMEEATTSGDLDKNDFNELAGEEIVTGSGEEIIITPSAHNTYLRVLLENGIIGLALLLMAWVWLSIKSTMVILSSRGMEEWLRPYAMVVFVSFVAYLPMGTFIDTLHWRFLWLIAGMLAGIIYLVKVTNNDEGR